MKQDGQHLAVALHRQQSAPPSALNLESRVHRGVASKAHASHTFRKVSMIMACLGHASFSGSYCHLN